MKPTYYMLLVGLFLLLGACSTGGNQSNDETVSSSALPNNTPLGQASVVDSESDANILQVALGSADHSTLVAAVKAANIEHILVNAGPLTVFAPTNEAFDKLPKETVQDLLKPENREMLVQILTRHAAPGSYDIEALKKEGRKGRKLYMATGDYLNVTMEGDDVYVGGAKVVASVQTSNGIINVVNDVILPETK